MMLRPALIGVALVIIVIGISAINYNVDGVVIAAGIATGVVGFFTERWRLRQTSSRE